MSWIEVPSRESFNYSNYNLILANLKIDEYYIFYNSSHYGNNSLELNSKTDECYKCPFLYENRIKYNVPYVQSSKWPAEWQITYDIRNVCHIMPSVQEFGIYELYIHNNSCNLTTLLEPVNIYLPILTVLLILFGAILFIYGINYLVYKFIITETKNEESRDSESEAHVKRKKRIQSLDTFISIVLMILVNYGAGQYNFIEHATWNGLHIGDLVFPWFMWIMGVCIPISIQSALKRNQKQIFWHIVKKQIIAVKNHGNFLKVAITGASTLISFPYYDFQRSCILFMLGLCLNRVYDIEYLRIFGVLQRFGLCYFFIATLKLLSAEVYSSQPEFRIKWLQDIYIALPELTSALFIACIHTTFIFTLPVPDCPTGYLGPGGMQEFGHYQNCTGGLTGYIDRKILGINHTYQYPTAKYIYSSIPFDPEGPFGTLTSIIQVILGVLAGTILQVYSNHKDRLLRWLLWGAATGLLGGALCGFSQENGVIPVNKNLWSLSFVLVTSCFAFLLLSLLYVVIDVKKWWNGKPFLFAGMNAVILYVGHSITSNMFPFQWGVIPNNFHFQLLVQSVWGTSLWIGVAYWLYKIEYFLAL